MQNSEPYTVNTPLPRAALKRIALDQARPGMYVADMCLKLPEGMASRHYFAIASAEDIEKLAKAGNTAITIDLGRSQALDLDQLGGPDVLGGIRTLQAKVRSVLSDVLQDELDRTRKFLDSARQAFSTFLTDIRSGRLADVDPIRGIADTLIDRADRDPSTVLLLLRLLDKDFYTFSHSIGVSALMIALAKQSDVPHAQWRDLAISGLLHDVGKIRVPEEILNKPGKLTDEEFALVKTHTTAGESLLSGIGVDDAISRDVVLHHHERLDGRGYPHQLSGSAVSAFARIAAVADVYDALTSKRPYHTAKHPMQVLRDLLAWSGSHLDRQVVESLIQSVGIFPAGSLVRLKSSRLAVVLGPAPGDVLKPRVRAFYCLASRRRLPHADIDLAASRTDDVVGLERADRWSFNLETVLSA